MLISRFYLDHAWWLCFSAIIYILFILVWFGRFERKEKICLTVSLFLGFTYYTVYDLTNQTSIENNEKGTVDIQGKIISSRKLASSTRQYELKTQHEKLLLRLVPNTAKEYEVIQQLKPGAKVTFTAKLAKPESARNPGAFDYERFLYFKRIHWIAEPTSIYEVKVMPAPRYSLIALLNNWQDYLNHVIESTYTPELVPLMKGLLLGDLNAIDPAINDVYKQLGISHVLAISGLHMVVLTAFMLLIFQLLGVSKETSLLLTAVIIPIYVLLAGASPSIVRAGIMSVIVLIGTYNKRKIDGLNVWGAALFCMLCWDPYQLWDVGFELSFGCVWGLMTFSSRVAEQIGFVGSPLASFISVDVAAQLTSYPLSVYYFHHYFLFSFFVNLLLVPLYSLLFIPFGFLCLGLGMIHPGLAYLITELLGFIYQEMTAVLLFFSNLSWANYFVAEPSSLWVVGYYMVLVHGLSIIRIKLALWMMILLGFVIWSMLPSFGRDKVTVTFLDVGQGDAIVVQSKTKTTLIDAGGIKLASTLQKNTSRWDAGRGVILPFLQWKGINHLDYVVGTHGDLDHIGGMSSVIKQIPVKMFLRNGKIPTTKEEKQLLKLLHERDIPVESVKRGSTWQDEAEVNWLVLKSADSEATDNDNNSSIVLLLEAYGYRLLFTGDLEREGEHAILNDQPRILPAPIDVLKIGHHGSRSSTMNEWVRTLRPSASIISVGKKNRYGHPHQETLQILEHYNSAVYRTDQQGAITIEITRDGMYVSAFLKQKRDALRQ